MIKFVFELSIYLCKPPQSFLEQGQSMNTYILYLYINQYMHIYNLYLPCYTFSFKIVFY